MRTRLILLFACFGTTLGQQLCFVRTQSTVRRDAIAAAPTASQKGCNILCVNAPGCDACMFYANSSRCVMLGEPRSPIPEACPAPYTCYERRVSGCPVCQAPATMDDGYTPSPCSTVLGPPVPGPPGPPCKPYSDAGQRKTIIDTITHDGTRVTRENHNWGTIAWDSTMCSWYHNLGMIDFYFASAVCVLPLPPPLLPGCGCSPLPTEPPMPGVTLHPTRPVPFTDVAPACPSNIQLRYVHAELYSGASLRVKPSAASTLYCAQGVWILVLDNGASFSSYSLDSATCVV